MKLPEFDRQMDRLRECYGAKYYPPERDRVFFEALKERNMWDLDKAITECIRGPFTPPDLSKILGFMPTNGHSARGINGIVSCAACSDLGFGFVGDTVVVCVCASGQKINPIELARQQGNYDRGRKMFRSVSSFRSFVSKPLPYDPNEREGA